MRQISTFGLCGLFSLLCLQSGAQPLARLVEEASRPAVAQSRFVRDPICEEIRVFRHDVRQLYNSRDFNELERIAARVAYADFFCSYAWHARGSDYADRVTAEGGKLFQARLASAHKIFDEARKLKEKHPYLAMVALTVALGEGPDKAEYDAIVEEADAAEPSFWRYDAKRDFSLLPRWHGKPGDWEAFALKAAARPDGLELMLKRYPESLKIVNLAARLAYMSRDREMAQALFVRLNGTCVASAWRGPEQFLGAQKWAQKTDK